jgi:ADP-ribosylglycohydrolase
VRNSKAFFRGCLLGGAVGDALGFPVEFLTRDEIRDVYGNEGIRTLVCEKETGKALVSDDTQTAVFTTDGLLWADKQAKKKGIYAYTLCIFYAYQKWLYTQTGSFAEKKYEFLLHGEVLKWEELFARRTPGEAILQALSGSINGKFGTMKNPINNSKGYNGVARVAPVGLYFYSNPKMSFQIGCESAAITHGHPTAYLTAGFFSLLISMIICGESLEDAINQSLNVLKRHKYSDEAVKAIRQAVELAGSQMPPDEAIPQMGEGWVAEEAMAIALYCALKHPDNFEDALFLAVNQDGNSNGTGAICGNILGAILGSLEIPYHWIQIVELGELLATGADRLLIAATELI